MRHTIPSGTNRGYPVEAVRRGYGPVVAIEPSPRQLGLLAELRVLLSAVPRTRFDEWLSVRRCVLVPTLPDEPGGDRVWGAIVLDAMALWGRADARIALIPAIDSCVICEGERTNELLHRHPQSSQHPRIVMRVANRVY